MAPRGLADRRFTRHAGGRSAQRHCGAARRRRLRAVLEPGRDTRVPDRGGRRRAVPDTWVDDVVGGAERFACLAIGPGLGRSTDVVAGVREVLRRAPVPVVVDGDALVALGHDAASILGHREAPTVLTPHDGEFEALVGRPPGDDRIDAARSLAAGTRATVLLKGPTTVVADPDGSVLLVRAGDARLATAGTGDVLTGLVAAHLALGAEPGRGAAAAAQLHGLAASLGAPRSLVASDLPDLVAAAWDRLLGTSGR